MNCLNDKFDKNESVNNLLMINNTLLFLLWACLLLVNITFDITFDITFGAN